jgi:hypothetical protein
MFTELVVYFVNRVQQCPRGRTGVIPTARRILSQKGIKKGKGCEDVLRFTSLFREQQQRLQKRCRWASIGFPYCKTHKLLKDIFHDPNLAKKMPCGRTKAEAVVKNFLVPGSVQDLLDVLRIQQNQATFLSCNWCLKPQKQKDIPTGCEVFWPS